jgi:hypothetical protein
MIKAMRLLRWVAVGFVVGTVLGAAFAQTPAQTPGPWDRPAAALAERIAGIVGPGQARLTLRNLSKISDDDLPAIRKSIEQDLKAHGVTVADDDSANAIRITLSENTHERLWVAEVVEGNTTRVAMVEAGAVIDAGVPAGAGLRLRTETLFSSREPILAALEFPNGLVVLEPEQIVFYTRAGNTWHEQGRVSIGQRRPLPRDPRGNLLSDGSGGFNAWLAATECSGSFGASAEGTASCHPSDDPWPVAAPGLGTAPMKAFFNAGRNYFTGVTTPSLGPELQPFYGATWIARSGGTMAMIAGGIDGKVLLIENGSEKPLAGARDWGSDFAVVHSDCGNGAQVIAPGSGEAATDSLRAYEVPALEAVPASAPLQLNGTVMALWTSPDGKSAMAVVRAATNQYEVDRVAATCN